MDAGAGHEHVGSESMQWACRALVEVPGVANTEPKKKQGITHVEPMGDPKRLCFQHRCTPRQSLLTQAIGRYLDVGLVVFR